MNKIIPFSRFSDFDLDLFRAGNHCRLYDNFGSHIMTVNGETGTYFAVFAPAAKSVKVIGDFNHWSADGTSELFVQWNGSGIWEGFIPGVQAGALYKYSILSNHDDKIREKADPYARRTEMPPKSASVVEHSDYKWEDASWMSIRHNPNSLGKPMSVYECHLGSWKKSNEEHRSLHYTELAEELVNYLTEMNFTHVEFLPVMEHPYYPSWGYLCTSYFAPTSRYGSPDDLRFLIDKLHQNNIGVILDWVPAHFPNDEFALADFDGTCLYEHPDRKKGFHPDWNSLIFNYEREEIRAFLLSSAHYWCKEFHVDGLRVDAVASMIYLDYSRDDGGWEPNIHGGNEYLAAIEFLKELNTSIYRDFPDIQMIAEESTAFNGVSRPVDAGGLGFGLKWMMGWMNDTLEYMSKDPIHRKYHHNEISRSLTYAFSENYMLPLSHDEVVHGKGSIAQKMPGDEWQKFANLRLLYCYMYTHPGQKLLFMGNDIGQTSEWNVDHGIEWHLLEFAPHKGVQKMIKDLNFLYKNEPALYEKNYDGDGFEWIEWNDSQNCVLAFIRKGVESEVIVICNFTPNLLENYRIGVPEKGLYKMIFNSDLSEYWGANSDYSEFKASEALPYHERSNSMEITVPPLGAIVYKLQSE